MPVHVCPLLPYIVCWQIVSPCAPLCALPGGGEDQNSRRLQPPRGGGGLQQVDEGATAQGHMQLHWYVEVWFPLPSYACMHMLA